MDGQQVDNVLAHLDHEDQVTVQIAKWLPTFIIGILIAWRFGLPAGYIAGALAGMVNLNLIKAYQLGYWQIWREPFPTILVCNLKPGQIFVLPWLPQGAQVTSVEIDDTAATIHYIYQGQASRYSLYAYYRIQLLETTNQGDLHAAA